MFEFPAVEQASATLLLNPEQTVATLFGECETKTMQELVQLLHELNALPEEERPAEFKLVLSSVGGDLYAALPLYEAIRSSAIPVWVHATGKCYSAATLLVCGAQKRTSGVVTRFMIHNLAYGFDLLSLKKAKEAHDEMVEYSKLLKNIYLTTCHVEPAVLEQIFESGEDYYFWADEALDKFGLIQAIV